MPDAPDLAVARAVGERTTQGTDPDRGDLVVRRGLAVQGDHSENDGKNHGV